MSNLAFRIVCGALVALLPLARPTPTAHALVEPPAELLIEAAPSSTAQAGSLLYFSTGDAVFQTDGTVTGTARLPGVSGSVVGLDDTLYVYSAQGILRLSGATSQTLAPANICTPGATDYCHFVAFNGNHFVLGSGTKTLHRISANGQTAVVAQLPNDHVYWVTRMYVAEGAIYISASYEGTSASTRLRGPSIAPGGPISTKWLRSDGVSPNLITVDYATANPIKVRDRLVNQQNGNFVWSRTGGPFTAFASIPVRTEGSFAQNDAFYYHTRLSDNLQKPGYELFRSDLSGPGVSIFHRPSDDDTFFQFGGTLRNAFVFRNMSAAWIEDGRGVGPAQFFDGNAQLPFRYQILSMQVINDLVVFGLHPSTSEHEEVWISNGTPTGTMRVGATIPQTGAAHNILTIVGVINGRLLITSSGDRPTVGPKLWSVAIPAVPHHSLQPIRAIASFGATDFDLGGEGLAFHDRERANLGNKSTSSEGVDIGTLAPADVSRGREYDILSFTFAGEWLNYTLDIEAVRSYTLSVQVASLGPGGTFHFELDGADISGPLSVLDTGGWANFRPVSVPNLAFPAGRHTLRLVMDTDGPGGGVGSFKTIALLGAGWATHSIHVPVLAR